MLSLTNLVGLGSLAGSGASGIAPDEITTKTLLGWWRSDLGITEETGGRVTDWVDQSSYGRTLSVGTGSASRPTIQSAALNGHDTIQFDGTDDYLDTGSFTKPAADTGALHVFWVGKQITWTSNEYALTLTSSNNRQVRQHTSTPQLRQSGNSANVNAVSPTLDTYFLLQSGFLTSTSSFQVLNDGSKVTGAAEGSAQDFNRVVLGASAVPSLYSNVEFAEVVILNGELTDATELSGLLDYFNARYSLW